MVESLQIKLGFGLFNISFGSIMADVEILLGQPEAVELLDEIEESQSTVWHYWELGFSLFFSILIFPSLFDSVFSFSFLVPVSSFSLSP